MRRWIYGAIAAVVGLAVIAAILLANGLLRHTWRNCLQQARGTAWPRSARRRSEGHHRRCAIGRRVPRADT